MELEEADKEKFKEVLKKKGNEKRQVKIYQAALRLPPTNNATTLKLT